MVRMYFGQVRNLPLHVIFTATYPLVNMQTQQDYKGYPKIVVDLERDAFA